MRENGQWERWVEDAKKAVYGAGGPSAASDWERFVFLADKQIQGMSAAFEKSVGIAKREVLQAIHAIAFDPPAPRSRSRRKDMVIRLGLPAVGGGSVLTLIVLEVLRLLGA